MNDGGFPPGLAERGQRGWSCLFHNIIIDNVMFCQDQLETNLLQPLAHPENPDWFSIISVIISEINIVAEQKQAYWK